MDFIPTNTLTHLDLGTGLEAIDRVKFTQFLRQCTTLERLQLLGWPTRRLLPDNFVPVSLPSLKSLHVNDTLALHFQLYLSAPNMVELHLYSLWGLPPGLPVQSTMLQVETVIWDHQLLRDLCHHHLVPLSPGINGLCRSVGFSTLSRHGLPRRVGEDTDRSP